MKNIKVVLLGERAVGKTLLVAQLLGRIVNGRYNPTIGIDFATYTKSGIKLLIWDTAGGDRFKVIVDKFTSESDLGIVVYNSKRSLQSVRNHIDTMRYKAKRTPRIALVSLCTDTENELAGQMLATTERIPFFTCAARNRAEVIEMWHHIITFCEYEINNSAWEVDDVTPRKPVNRPSYCFWW